VVEACIAAGLVGGQGLAVDASLIVADANKQRSIPGSDWKKQQGAQASRAVKEYLATLDEAATRRSLHGRVLQQNRHIAVVSVCAGMSAAGGSRHRRASKWPPSEATKNY